MVYLSPTEGTAGLEPLMQLRVATAKIDTLESQAKARLGESLSWRCKRTQISENRSGQLGAQL